MSQQLDSSAITEIRDMVLATLVERKLADTDCDTIALPASVSVKSLEQFNLERYRFRGSMETSSIDEYVKYSSGYAGEGVRCFIDADEMRAQTIFNIGTLSNPGHADNTASLSLKKQPHSANCLALMVANRLKKNSLNGWKTIVSSYWHLMLMVRCWI